MDTQAAESLLTFAERAGPALKGPDAKAILGQIDRQYEDLQTAMQWFIDQRRTNEGLRLANALYNFWITKQRFDDGAVWFDRILGLEGGDDTLRGTAFIGAGFMAFWKGEDSRAAACYRQGLEVARRLRNPFMIARALGGLCRVA